MYCRIKLWSQATSSLFDSEMLQICFNQGEFVGLLPWQLKHKKNFQERYLKMWIKLKLHICTKQNKKYKIKKILKIVSFVQRKFSLDTVSKIAKNNFLCLNQKAPNFKPTDQILRNGYEEFLRNSFSKPESLFFQSQKIKKQSLVSHCKYQPRLFW